MFSSSEQLEIFGDPILWQEGCPLLKSVILKRFWTPRFGIIFSDIIKPSWL